MPVNEDGTEMSQDKNEPKSGSERTLRPFRVINGSTAEGEMLSNIASGSIAQIVVAVAAVLALCYVAKLPLITLMIAILLTFVLAPLVDRLERWRVPRFLGSLLAVGLLLACLYGLAYFSYAKAIDFVDQLPKYSENIRHSTLGFRKQAEKIEATREAVIPGSTTSGQSVTVKEQHGVTDWITSSFSGITEVVLSLSFIPFLTYFMLSWKDRTREATEKLFDPQNRHKAHVTLTGIADMLRAFLVGNLV